MLIPVKVKADNGVIGWCVYDTNSLCILEDIGIYETVSECDKAIDYYLAEEL